jgi:hypothetical protein
MVSVNEEQLPHVTSSVERFLVNPDGDADGMILLNGVEVYFAPYLSDAVLMAVHVGDRITVYGELPMAEPLIVASIIEAEDGSRIEDAGRVGAHRTFAADVGLNRGRERSRLQVEALVRRALHGPSGELRGVLLDDGTTVFFSVQDGENLEELLSPAAWVTVRGAGLVTELGTAIEADEIGQSAQAMRVLQH